MTRKALSGWYGYLAIMPQNHLNNVTVTGPALSSRWHDCSVSENDIGNGSAISFYLLGFKHDHGV
jgi:hypothetical protein